jgi:hypothetical protein
MTYPATPTYWLEATDLVSVGLRRYRSSGGAGFTCEDGYHSALVFTGEAPAVFNNVDEFDRRTIAPRPATPHDDAAWPTHCQCGYEFVEDDEWQDWQELIYQRSDTGERFTLRSKQAYDIGGFPAAPPGACWDAWWMPGNWRGPDGIALMVRCPNGSDWHVDGRASNCGRPDDKVHKCWVRHGDPRAANVTVDKDGDTCAAGAGSIQAGDYHGFLQAGVLTAG